MSLKSLISILFSTLVLIALPAAHAGELPSYLPKEKAPYTDTLVADCSGIQVLERSYIDASDKQLFAIYTEGTMQDYFFPIKLDKEFSKMDETKWMPIEIKTDVFSGKPIRTVRFTVERSWSPAELLAGYSYQVFFTVYDRVIYGDGTEKGHDGKKQGCTPMNQDISAKMQKIEAHIKKYGSPLEDKNRN